MSSVRVQLAVCGLPFSLNRKSPFVFLRSYNPEEGTIAVGFLRLRRINPTYERLNLRFEADSLFIGYISVFFYFFNL
jgi:hypothetical protein